MNILQLLRESFKRIECSCGKKAKYFSEDLLQYFCSDECFDAEIQEQEGKFRYQLNIDNRGLKKI